MSSVGDTYATFASTYEEASKKITNPDVKQAASGLASSISEMVNYGKKYQSNPNAADQKEAERLVSNMTNAMLTLNNLCPAALDY